MVAVADTFAVAVMVAAAGVAVGVGVTVGNVALFLVLVLDCENGVVFGMNVTLRTLLGSRPQSWSRSVWLSRSRSRLRLHSWSRSGVWSLSRYGSSP
jgi:hypothetical protein